MRTCVAASLFSLALLTVPAHAQIVDVSTIKCGQFIAGDKDNIAMIMMWLGGYYSDEDSDPVIDFNKMKAQGEKIGKYCAENPDVGLITAAERIMKSE